MSGYAINPIEEMMSADLKINNGAPHAQIPASDAPKSWALPDDVKQQVIAHIQGALRESEMAKLDPDQRPVEFAARVKMGGGARPGRGGRPTQNFKSSKVAPLKFHVPRLQATKAEAPKADVSKTDVSKTEVSKTEVSRTEVSRTDMSKTDVSKTDVSKTDVSKTDVSKTDGPRTDGVRFAGKLKQKSKSKTSDGDGKGSKSRFLSTTDFAKLVKERTEKFNKPHQDLEGRKYDSKSREHKQIEQSEPAKTEFKTDVIKLPDYD